MTTIEMAGQFFTVTPDGWESSKAGIFIHPPGDGGNVTGPSAENAIIVLLEELWTARSPSGFWCQLLVPEGFLAIDHPY